MEEEGYFSYNKRVYRARPLILNVLIKFAVDVCC